MKSVPIPDKSPDWDEIADRLNKLAKKSRAYPIAAWTDNIPSCRQLIHRHLRDRGLDIKTKFNQDLGAFIVWVKK